MKTHFAMLFVLAASSLGLAACAGTPADEHAPLSARP